MFAANDDIVELALREDIVVACFLVFIVLVVVVVVVVVVVFLALDTFRV